MSYRTWVIAIGEPLPIDAGEPRLLRAGILSKMLAAAGHEVTWWTSNIDHTHKRRRLTSETEKALSPNLRMILLDGELYKANVSLARIRNHRQIASAFKRRSAAEIPPDIILCSFPTIELTHEVVAYARKHDIPAVVDIRDLWPEAIVDLAPRPFRWLLRLAMMPMRASAMRALKQASAIVGITKEYRDWGLTLATRNAGPLDRVFPLAYVSAPPPVEAQRSANEFWRTHGVSIDTSEFVVAFFGYLGRQFDLDTVIAAAKLLKIQQLPVRFVLCGTGDSLDRYRKLVDNLDNVVLPGWVNSPQIWSLMRHAQLGLAPYIDSENFRKNIPNKIIEYLSAGLPVISCLQGAAENLLRTNDAGYFYTPGSEQNLAHSISEAYSNREVLARRSEQARALFLRSFSADHVYGDMIHYLEGIADKSKNS